MSVYCGLQNETLTCFPTLKGSKKIRHVSNTYSPNAYTSASPALQNAWVSFKVHKRINFSSKIKYSAYHYYRYKTATFQWQAKVNIVAIILVNNYSTKRKSFLQEIH